MARAVPDTPWRDLPDEEDTYALVDTLNRRTALSAYTYDPADGSVSARCGALVGDGDFTGLGPMVAAAVTLQPSMAWAAAAVLRDRRGLARDEEPHPLAGSRPDDAPVIRSAVRLPAAPPPVDRALLRRAAGAFAAADWLVIPTEEHAADAMLVIALPPDGDIWWGVTLVAHPLLGQGLAARLLVPRDNGPARAAWLANALNLAESADTAGEPRAHALGAWTGTADALIHTMWLPASVFSPSDEDRTLESIALLLAWGVVRSGFAAERLPWLEAAARSRYPG